MEFFKKQFNEIREYLAKTCQQGEVKEIRHKKKGTWPKGKAGNLVLEQDMAVELGHPQSESTAMLIWTNDSGNIKDRQITIIGPELPEAQEKQLPFGKAVLIGGNDFTIDNSYDRYREMESIRYDVDLKGYMMRAASQYQREWSRVSNEAILEGFTLEILGGALIDQLKEIEFVTSVEVIFVTSNKEDVGSLKTISEQAIRITSAMNKMAVEMSLDCSECEFEDICDEVSALKSMRDSMKMKEGETIN